MAEYKKFKPDITPMHQPFWDSVKQHDIRLQRCKQCGTFRFVPVELCHKCYSSDYTWEPIQGKGEVYTYTVVHRAPTPAYQEEAPYIIAHVTMAEGPRMISQMKDCPLDKIKIGLPVKIAYEDVTPELSLYKFQPA